MVRGTRTFLRFVDRVRVAVLSSTRSLDPAGKLRAPHPARARVALAALCLILAIGPVRALDDAGNPSVQIPASNVAALALTTPLPATWLLGIPFQTQVVQLRDERGNPLRRAGVPVAATASGKCLTLSGATAVTDASGQAIFRALTLRGAALPRVVTFSSAGLGSASSVTVRLQWGPAVAGDTVSVSCFDARGDGVTDDQPAIQRALDSISNDGGTVSLPVGSFLLRGSAGGVSRGPGDQMFPNGSQIESALIVRRHKLKLQGEGGGSVLMLAPRAKIRVLTIDRASDVTLQDFVADGNKSQRDGSRPWPNADVVDGLIYGNVTTRQRFVRVEARNGLEDGLAAWRGTEPVVESCYSHDNGLAGVGAAGVSLNGGSGAAVLNSRIENNSATGIWFAYGAIDSTARGNRISGQLGAAITLGGFSVDLGAGRNHGYVIDGNTITGNGSRGFPAIHILGASAGVIAGNRISDNAFDGIKIESEVGTPAPPSTAWVLRDNWIGNSSAAHSQSRGVYVGGHAEAVLRSNTIQNNGRSIADQLVIGHPEARINADWQSSNALSFAR